VVEGCSASGALETATEDEPSPAAQTLPVDSLHLSEKAELPLGNSTRADWADAQPSPVGASYGGLSFSARDGSSEGSMLGDE